MIKLGVNIDHVATLRQARYRQDLTGPNVEPDVLAAAAAAIAGGADSITIHPRADGRHIQQEDARALRAAIAVPLNLEMGATAAMESLALEISPAFACIVPELREEVTTEGGLDVIGGGEPLSAMVTRLQDAGILVSLFIDPDPESVAAAIATGAAMVELHTGAFANAIGSARQQERDRLAAAASQAHAGGLQVNAGHGIQLANLPELAAVPHLAELNIGHSIVSRALFIGLEAAVREMRQQIDACFSEK